MHGHSLAMGIIAAARHTHCRLIIIMTIHTVNYERTLLLYADEMHVCMHAGCTVVRLHACMMRAGTGSRGAT